MPKEISPEAKQFYLAVTASLTTLLIVEIIRAVKDKATIARGGRL